MCKLGVCGFLLLFQPFLCRLFPLLFKLFLPLFFGFCGSFRGLTFGGSDFVPVGLICGDIVCRRAVQLGFEQFDIFVVRDLAFGFGKAESFVKFTEVVGNLPGGLCELLFGFFIACGYFLIVPVNLVIDLPPFLGAFVLVFGENIAEIFVILFLGDLMDS